MCRSRARGASATAGGCLCGAAGRGRGYHGEGGPQQLPPAVLQPSRGGPKSRGGPLAEARRAAGQFLLTTIPAQ